MELAVVALVLLVAIVPLWRRQHHAPGSTGSLCYNCHMPYTAYALLKAVRSHQVDSPSARATVESGRPDACNLCHLDRSLGWTARTLATGYGQPLPSLTPEDDTIAASLLWLLRGDAGQRALVAWAAGWRPARAISGERRPAAVLARVAPDRSGPAVLLDGSGHLTDDVERLRGAHDDRPMFLAE